MPPDRGLGPALRAFLADLAGGAPRSEEERSQAFEPPPFGSVRDRWAIYERGYVVRVEEALDNDYPALRRVLGPSAFGSLARRYVKPCPPRSFDLGQVGDRLPRFLATDPLTTGLPFLADLARLEWAVATAFVAADTEPLAWDDVVARGAEAAAATPLALRPGTALIRSAWPIHDLWAARELADDAVSIPLEDRPQTVLVFRQGLQVSCRTVDETSSRLVERAARGGCLEDAQADVESSEDADAVVRRFRDLVEQGVFCRVGPPDGPAGPRRVTREG